MVRISVVVMAAVAALSVQVASAQAPTLAPTIKTPDSAPITSSTTQMPTPTLTTTGVSTPVTTVAPTSSLLATSGEGCIPCSLNVEVSPDDLRLVEGELKSFEISLPAEARKDIPAVVTLKAGKGLALSKTTFSFNKAGDANTYKINAKFNAASCLATGSKVPLTIEWGYPSLSSCVQKTRTIELEVQKGTTISGNAAGDPHFRSLDNAYFDFQGNGVFKLVQSKNMEVQVATRKCNGGFVTCMYGVAVAIGDSVARLVVENKQIAITKGTDSINGLSIEKSTGRANSYRIFIKSDQATYIDVNMGIVAGLEYFDVATVLSPYFRDDVTGLLGNGNGNPNDDERDQNKLSAAFKITNSDENLFTCTSGNCAVKPLTEADAIPVDPITLLHQGYTPVDAGLIASRKAVLQAAGTRRSLRYSRRRAPSLNKDKVRSLCDQVITSIPLCDKYVEDLGFFVENVCVQDTLLTGDLKNIDNVKLAYLRQCRRDIDSTIVLDAGISRETKAEAKDDRAILSLANPNTCTSDCNGRGKCLLNGCICEKGYSGLACEIQLAL
jgi:hypothetical protein